MGNFSLWHWLIVVFLFGGLVVFAGVITFVSIRIAKSKEDKAKHQKAIDEARRRA